MPHPQTPKAPNEGRKEGVIPPCTGPHRRNNRPGARIPRLTQPNPKMVRRAGLTALDIAICDPSPGQKYTASKVCSLLFILRNFNVSADLLNNKF